jgi:hypothetical protein
MTSGLRDEIVVLSLAQLAHPLEDLGGCRCAVGMAALTFELVGSLSIRAITENHADSAADVVRG